MLGAIIGYCILTLYAVMAWQFSNKFPCLGGVYKKWAIPALLMGSVLFGGAEIWLISKIADCASVEGKAYFYGAALIVTVLDIAITGWGMRKYKKISYKTVVAAISIIAIIIGYL